MERFDERSNMTSFEDEVMNVRDCIRELNLTKDDNLQKKISQATDFLQMLPAIIRSACVLAVYAGEDQNIHGSAYGFGADSYDYLDKYVKGGMEMAVDFGTGDFYNYFDQYFVEEIMPVSDYERGVILNWIKEARNKRK